MSNENHTQKKHFIELKTKIYMTPLILRY